MNDQMNGKDHIPPEAAAQSAQAASVLNQITPTIRAAVQTTMRGVLTGYEGVPAHVLLQILCFEAAFYAGQALQADLTTTINLRTQFKKAFEDGLKKVPLMMGAPPMPPPPGQPNV